MAEPDFVSDVLTTNPMLFPPGKGSDNKAGGGGGAEKGLYRNTMKVYLELRTSVVSERIKKNC